MNLGLAEAPATIDTHFFLCDDGIMIVASTIDVLFFLYDDEIHIEASTQKSSSFLLPLWQRIDNQSLDFIWWILVLCKNTNPTRLLNPLTSGPQV